MTTTIDPYRNRILKNGSYKVVNVEPFDLPLPLDFELWHENTLLAAYHVDENQAVDYSFNVNTSKRVLTTTYRPLTVFDVYFLLITRAFPLNTPFAEKDMARINLLEYNPCEVVRKTRGMNMVDKYWLKFAGDTATFRVASAEFKDLFKEESESGDSKNAADYKEHPVDPGEIANIIGQYSLDINKIETKVAENPDIEGFNPQKYIPREDGSSGAYYAFGNAGNTGDITNVAVVPDEGTKMSDSEIAAMLAALGTSVDEEPPPFVAADIPADAVTSVTNDKMSDDAIAALLAAQTAPAPAPAASDKMSDDAIAALLAAQTAPAPAPAASDKMSDDAIAALLAAQTAPAPAPAASDKMSDDAIAALLAAQTAPAPAPAPAASDKMSDDAIAALLAAQTAPAPAASDKMSDDAIAALLAAQTAPAPAPAASDKMSDDAIAALLAAQTAPAPAASDKMSDDAIAALLAAQNDE